MIQSTAKQINKFDIYARDRRYGNNVLENWQTRTPKRISKIELSNFSFDIEIRTVHNVKMEWMQRSIFVDPTPDPTALKNRKINNKQNKYTRRFASVKVKENAAE